MRSAFSLRSYTNSATDKKSNKDSSVNSKNWQKVSDREGREGWAHQKGQTVTRIELDEVSLVQPRPGEILAKTTTSYEHDNV